MAQAKNSTQQELDQAFHFVSKRWHAIKVIYPQKVAAKYFVI